VAHLTRDCNQQNASTVAQWLERQLKYATQQNIDSQFTAGQQHWCIY